METLSSRVEEAHAHRQLQNELRQVEERLDALLRSHPRETRQAAEWIMRQAKTIWEEERHLDAQGWVRPLPRVERVFELGRHTVELGQTINRTSEQEEEQFKTTKAHADLCEELGVATAIGNPDQDVILAIATPSSS